MTGHEPGQARRRWIIACAALMMLLARASALRGSIGTASTAERDDPVIRLAFGPAVGPDDQPPGREPLHFARVARHTRYLVQQDGEGWVLCAEADASASGLYHPLDTDPRRYRYLSWRWKVDRVLATADARAKAGDDSPARLYVTFADPAEAGTLWARVRRGIRQAFAGRPVPSAALTYMWDNRLPPGTILDNFDVQFDNPRWPFRVIAWFMNTRSRWSGIATGDQALFVRRRVFESVGGYPDIPLMEDVELSRRLKRAGRLACLRPRVTTAARKWEREGVARTVAQMWALRLPHFCRVSPTRLHDWCYPALARAGSRAATGRPESGA